MHIGPDTAFLSPTEGLEILKIDDTLLRIIPNGVWAFKISKQKYSSVSLAPGRHVVVVNIEYFGKGSVFFLEADFLKDKLYQVKFDVTDRVEGKNIWLGDVWIEDSTNGVKVSKVIKHL